MKIVYQVKQDVNRNLFDINKLDVNKISDVQKDLASSAQKVFEYRLFEIIKDSEIQVNSAHHQAVKELGKNLIISGLARDGIVESIESTEHDWCIGVQWHPEFLITKADKLLISSFIEFSQKKL